jgi:hypothetical protein
MRLGTVQADPLRAIELAGSIESRQEANELLLAATASAAKMGTGVLRQLATTPMKPWMLWPILSEFSARDPELAVDLVLNSGAEGMIASNTLQNAFAALTQRDEGQSISKLEGLKEPKSFSRCFGHRLRVGWSRTSAGSGLVGRAARFRAQKSKSLRQQRQRYALDSLLRLDGKRADRCARLGRCAALRRNA